ncbi:MAG: DNA cytosine methyltransferase [Candidatus Omnitrophota bacterium]
MDLGFIQSGHDVVWANDIDPDCVETYKANIGDHIVLGDIRCMDVGSLPDAEIVIGGFPCQGFSCANLKRSDRDERNNLYIEFFKVIKNKQPMFFVAENVRGILSLSGGRAMRMIMEDFSGAGYRVEYRLFDVADFGVPQNRRRVIIYGIRNDLPEDLTPKFPAPTHAKDSKSTSSKRWVTIGDALENVPDPDSSEDALSNHVFSKYKVTNRDFTGHRTTDPNKPSPTILARGNGKGGVCAIQHPSNKRRLSVRESAIIQTFPNDFIFSGSMTSMYRQIGNAVPVHFAKKVALEFTKIESRLMEQVR